MKWQCIVALLLATLTLAADAASAARQFHSYKGSKWKTFFHLPRYLFNCIEVIKRLEARK